MRESVPVMIINKKLFEMVKITKKLPASKRSGDVKIFTDYQFLTNVSLTAMPVGTILR
jgi:hypothetical protein